MGKGEKWCAFKVGQSASEIEYILSRTGRTQITVPVSVEEGTYETTIEPDGVVLVSLWDSKEREYIVSEVKLLGEQTNAQD